MNNAGIKFLPLYWIYHDNWINRTWSYSDYRGWEASESSRHMGHLHFFMPSYEFNNKSKSGQAYSGKQSYDFSLKSIWGPGSGDVNQTNDVKFIGSPKWYFDVDEYWRRVYIQPWEDRTHNENNKSIVDKIGIKYDASHKNHTYGPFREGQGFFFYWNKSARTLPIEYYLDEKKRTRNNFLYGQDAWYLPININYDISNSDSDSRYMKKQYVLRKTPFFIPNGNNDSGYVDRPLCWRINGKTRDSNITESEFNRWKNIATEIGATFSKDTQGRTVIKYCDYGYHKYPESSNSESDSSWRNPFGAFNVSCSDARYIYPIIEYQRVKHLNGERLPGWSQRDRDEGGDGFDIKVELPYCVNGKVQSPFSEDNGNVVPMGQYCHGFDEKFNNMIPKYPYCDQVDIGNYQWVIVKRVDDGFANITEVVLRIEIGEKQPSNLGPGEYIAKQEPYPNGYIQDEYGRPVYAKRYDITTEEYRIPENWKGKTMTFNVPANMKEDGAWVEQCFGGIVKAKAVVTIEDNFGLVRDVEIVTTRFYLAEQFEGSDQNAPAT
jgi:hypothetical protein